MKKLSFWKTSLLALVGTSLANSIAVLPVRAIEDTASDRTAFWQSQDGNYEVGDDLKKIVGLTGLAVGTGVIGYHLSKTRSNSRTSSIPYLNEKVALVDRISPKLRRELLRLVNRNTANRLLTGTLVSHGGRSPNWVAEKVIYDLKRGR